MAGRVIRRGWRSRQISSRVWGYVATIGEDKGRLDKWATLLAIFLLKKFQVRVVEYWVEVGSFVGDEGREARWQQVGDSLGVDY